VAFPRSAQTARLRNELLEMGCHVGAVPVGLPADSKIGAYLAIARDLIISLWTIARVRPDAALLNLPTPEATPGAMIACALARVKTTAIFHLVRSDLSVTTRRRKLYRRLARSPQHWLCVSEDNRKILGNQFGVGEQRIAVVRNGVTPRKVSSSVSEETRADLHISATATLVLTTGRLSEQKDHNVILQALPALVALDESLVFIWAGDGPLREKLRQAADATGLGQHVRLLGRREDVPELLAAADLFLMPSRYEGGAPPFALAEAMFAGTPAVVSDIGALSEIIEDGRNGLVFVCGDPYDLVSAVARALADREKIQGMATAAREQAARDFTVERMTEGLLAHILRPPLR
jgi:glycosyltransferase involved in cell wall biosynthesis